MMWWTTFFEEGHMELSLRLDTLGIVEVRYLRGRERFRDWPPFLLFAASRQARVLAYLTRETLEQLHNQILQIEEAAGLNEDDDDDDDEEIDLDLDPEELQEADRSHASDLESSQPQQLSPAFAQALERLNELARQKLPEGGSGQQPSTDELPDDNIALVDEEAALEQLQEALVQMMEVVRDLADELATDALKITGRLRCAKAEIFFTRAEQIATDDDDEDEEDDDEDGLLDLALILRLYEEGHVRPDDLPAVELQLDVDDFERLHETLDIALERERRSRRRRGS
jgi:hypothetical protein